MRIPGFRRILATAALSAVLALASSPIAEGQIASETVNTIPAQFSTYGAAALAVTPAASATDVLAITGAANKQVRVRKIHCDGTSTANGTTIVQVVKRSTADSGGTSTAPAKVPYNSSTVAAVATIKVYTANPTLGTAIGTVAEAPLTTDAATSGVTNNTGVTFDFSNQNVILNSATDALALNANATSFPSGAALDCTVEWSEN